MATVLWIIAVVLVIAGIVQLIQGQIALGIVLIVVGLLVGPGGVSIFAATPAGAAGEVIGDHPVRPNAALEVFTLATLGAVAVKLTSVAKYLTAGQVREALTQALPWTIAAGTLWVGAQAAVTEHLAVWGGQSLGAMDGWSLLLAGISLGSSGSLVYDFKKARDNSDTATEPPLGGGRLDRHEHERGGPAPGVRQT